MYRKEHYSLAQPKNVIENMKDTVSLYVSEGTILSFTGNVACHYTEL